MASVSKRSQARNEKALQELIRNVPGNDQCADCGAKNPGWTSWSLGVFLCIRCASLHRKLGTHISKVKSLSMDSWSNEQVEGMKQKGNAKVNRHYNPQNSKPPIPLDVDEVDAVLERFIRQKYDHQSFIAGSSQTTRPSVARAPSDHYEETAPLPPKPGRRFGFGLGLRSASSAIPLHFSGSSPPARSPPLSSARDMEAPRINKQSRVFGTNVGGSNDSIDAKLAQLREMGFADEKRNTSVLKGFGGNLDKTIEQLVRLGEGSAPTSRSRTPIQPSNGSSYQPKSSSTSSPLQTNGLSMVSKAEDHQPAQSAQETSSPAQPLQQAPTRSLSPLNPYAATTNGSNSSAPPTAQADAVRSIDQAFSNVQISQQPLFPNATGGYPNPPSHFTNMNARLQTMTPPVPQPQYAQPGIYGQQTPNSTYHNNPFLQATTSSQAYFTQPNANMSRNPFQQQSPASSPQIGYQADSPQTYSPQQPSIATFQSQQAYNTNDNVISTPQAFTHPAPQAFYQAPQPQQAWNPFQQQSLPPQPTGRLDKTSILALYNYPQLAPQPEVNDGPRDTQNSQAPAVSESKQPSAPQRSVTMPVPSVSGSKNPFQSSMKPQPKPTVNPPGVGRHISQESVDIGGFQNGRHSPDAFASLSARYVR